MLGNFPDCEVEGRRRRKRRRRRKVYSKNEEDPEEEGEEEEEKNVYSGALFVGVFMTYADPPEEPGEE